MVAFERCAHRVTFTDPEVAQVGRLEHEARFPESTRLRIGCWPLSRMDRAVCDNDNRWPPATDRASSRERRCGIRLYYPAV
jgi:hypothetical protein